MLTCGITQFVVLCTFLAMHSRVWQFSESLLINGKRREGAGSLSQNTRDIKKTHYTFGYSFMKPVQFHQSAWNHENGQTSEGNGNSLHNRTLNRNNGRDVFLYSLDSDRGTVSTPLDQDSWNDRKLVDVCEISVAGGNGGNGCVSFRREKHVPLGGADGGNGGPGGSVYIESDSAKTDLRALVSSNLYRAENGKHGRGNKMNGAKGKDLVLHVPVGTVVYGPEEEVYANLAKHGDRIRIARGGQGGKGNKHFITRLNTAPRMCERGEAGISRTVKLVYKKPSDIALVGKPNAGKSSIIKALTNAKPRIANFPFSTKFPIHGVIQFDEGPVDFGGYDVYDEEYEEMEEYLDEPFYENDSYFLTHNIDPREPSKVPTNGTSGEMGEGQDSAASGPFVVDRLLVVDIPGLIEGSSVGRGLGLDFLRHVERCKIIAYVIDSHLQDPVGDYMDVKRELGNYDADLLSKLEIIILNKIDLIDNARILDLTNQFLKQCDHDRIFLLSAKTGENVGEVTQMMNKVYSEHILPNFQERVSTVDKGKDTCTSDLDESHSPELNQDSENTGTGDASRSDNGVRRGDSSGKRDTKSLPGYQNLLQRSDDKNKIGSASMVGRLDSFRGNSQRNFKIEKREGVFTLKSPYLERKVQMMRFDLPETFDHFRRILKRTRVQNKLINMGMKQGDVLSIGNVSFKVDSDQFFSPT